jgi:ribonuclease P protein component
LVTLTHRQEFREAARGRRAGGAHFTLLLRPAPEPDLAGSGLRFGFTVTKKIGNSVERNRIRRRLREAVRRAAPAFADRRLDVVVLARRSAMAAPFEELVTAMARGLARLCEASPEKAAQSKLGKAPAFGHRERGQGPDA